MHQPAGRREWIGLAVLCLPVLIASMDVSVLFFAVPFIAQDLQPSATQQLWIFDVYGFVLAGLLLTMGSLATGSGVAGSCWSARWPSPRPRCWPPTRSRPAR